MVEQLKMSKHALIIPGENGSFFVFHTISKRILLVKKNIIDKIAEGKIDYISPKEKTLLRNEGILIDKEIDEDLLAEYLINEFKFRREIDVTILTTYRCNLACSYCYQGGKGFKKGGDLNLKTAREVIAFLKKLVLAKNPKILTVEFYGGEPLLRYDLIELIAGDLSRFCREKDIGFTFGIMTNGVLLSKKMVGRLKKLGLWRIQLTLDGPPRIHDKRKPLVSGRGTFEKIVKTIKEISSEIIPVVRVNVDRKNADFLLELIDVLKKEKIGKLIEIYFVPTLQKYKKNVNQCNPSFQAGDRVVVRKIAEAIKAAQRARIRLANSYYAIAPCHFYMDNSFIIDPRGNIFKCLALSETKVGNVENDYLGIKQSECVEVNAWKNRQCFNCKYLFMCLGGCRYQAKIEKGDYQAKVCNRFIFERLTPELLKASERVD